MTTTARHATRRIATDTADLLDLVTTGLLDDFDACALCTLPTAEFFTRIDNRDGTEVRVCESCADSADVSYCD